MFIPNTFTPETLRAVKAIIEETQERKYAYYFKETTPMAERDAYAKKHTHPRIEWAEGGHYFSAEYVVDTAYFTKDGRKTNVLPIKNSVKRMEVILA